MNVANKGVIRTLTLRSLKAGRLRNAVAVAAIALTAILFTAIFTIGGNMLASIQTATMRQVGTSAHGGLKYLTQEQYDNFKQSPLLRDISYSRSIAIAENEELQKKQTEIRYGEDDCAKWMFSYPTVGKMPQAGKELACSTLTLDMLGIPHELGQTVPLEFSIHGVKYVEEFTLCGYWPGDNVMKAAQVWLSREYTDSIISVPDKIDMSAGFGSTFGSINADVWFGSSMDIEGKMDALLAERGYTTGEISIGVNWAYVGSEMSPDITTVMMLALILGLILLSGYLIIYSVFTISVAGDIRFYGLLKTIGTTGKQLRGIVRGQALTLSAFGIPLGLIAGYFIGCALTPALMNITTMEGDFTTSVSPLIFVFAAVFSIVTVFISCRKPGRIASRVSPVEAVRYTDAPTVNSKKKAKRTVNVSPITMAWANVRRNPKKLVLIVVSLSLSLILLNSVYSMVRGFNMEKYLETQIISDFSAADYSVYSPMIRIDQDNFEGVDAAFVSGVAELEGLEDLANIYFYDDPAHRLSELGLENFNTSIDYSASDIEKYWPHVLEQIEEAKESGIIPIHVYAIEEMAARLMERSVLNGEVDYDKLQSGDYVLTTVMALGGNNAFFPLYDVGDTVTLTNETGQTRVFEVLAVLEEYPYSISCQHSHIYNGEIIMADNVYLNFYGEKQPMMTIFNVDDGHIPAAEEWIASYIAERNPSMDYRSRDYYKAEFENMRRTFMLLGGALSFILALIGILNFLNAIVTSILARRRELAMLQSVGMTGRQLKAMLQIEGISYAALTVLFTGTIGTLLGWLIVRVIAGQMWFFEWTFTLTPLMIAILPLAAICAFVPVVCYRFMRRESVVERLREVE